ncbi:MAG TPA: DEAD/DEAH box helicase [Acidimicrobiia bacterium]|nr:DEAD/DEAH box helicase [Acidimicrobiia bacterium]
MTETAITTTTTTLFTDLGVSDEITRQLADRGITAPFPIQTMTIPDGLAGRDVCGKAQTGSGKSLAFGIPLIQRTRKAVSRQPASLVLVPTRELCLQVAEELQPLAVASDRSLIAVYGGAPMGPQIDALRDGVDIVVATPGRLIDLIRRKTVDVGQVDCVVLDEADQMADMGFLPQVRSIMRSVGGTPQVMLFSATLDGAVRSLVNAYLRDPVRHEVITESDIVEEQTHRFISVHYRDKAKVAARVIGSVERTLVFVGTKANADRVARQLHDEGVDARAIHGDKQQRDRERVLGDFAEGKLPALVATNIAARGLHIDDVDVVLHFDPPQDYKSFVHRSGRTARAGETGLVVTLVEWDQVEDVERLQRASGLNYEIVKMFSNDDRLDDLVGFEPDEVEPKTTSDVDISRRFRRGRRRR